MSFSIHVDLLVAVHTLIKDTLDGGGSSAKIVIKGTSGGTPNTTLVTLALSYPCGSVNSGTGRLTLEPGLPGDPVATGTAVYGEIQDKDGKKWFTLPVVAGSTAIDDAIVIDTTSVVIGYPVQLISCTIG